MVGVAAVHVVLAREETCEGGNYPAEDVIGLQEGPCSNLDDPLKALVGEHSDEDSPGKRENGQADGNGPLHAVHAGDGEDLAADEHDGDLAANHKEVDTQKVGVALQSREAVEAVIQPSRVELVKDLEPHEGVEDHRVELKHSMLVVLVVAEHLGAGKVERDGDGELEYDLADDHLPHIEGDQRSRLLLRGTVEYTIGGRICGEDDPGECIHEEVHPEQLDGREYRLHLRVRDRADESEDHGSDGHCDLELEKLLHRVVANGLGSVVVALGIVIRDRLTRRGPISGLQ